MEKNLRFQVKKSNYHFAEGLMVLLEPGSPQSMSLQQFVTGNNILYYKKKQFLHFRHEKP